MAKFRHLSTSFILNGYIYISITTVTNNHRSFCKGDIIYEKKETYVGGNQHGCSCVPCTSVNSLIFVSITLCNILDYQNLHVFTDFTERKKQSIFLYYFPEQ